MFLEHGQALNFLRGKRPDCDSPATRGQGLGQRPMQRMFAAGDGGPGGERSLPWQDSWL